MPFLRLPQLLALAALLVLGPLTTRAAESYDNCTGFITSLPAVITTQGTWCLKQDLSTAQMTGNAISINTNNVTVDCNNFKLGGLSAGASTQTYGIGAISRSNITVRQCTIRGFLYGVRIEGSPSGGHVVEDNRFDSNTYNGVYVAGDGSAVRRNLVIYTAGSTIGSDTTPIWTVESVDIIDNTVENSVARAGTNQAAYGIYTHSNVSGRIEGNGISGVVADGLGTAKGIYNSLSDRITLRNNDVVGAGTGTGIFCDNGNGRTVGNVVNGFATGISGCSDNSGNVVTP